MFARRAFVKVHFTVRPRGYMESFLSHLSSADRVSPFDLMLGRSVQQDENSHAHGILGVYTAKAFRLGHMAVFWNGNAFSPTPQEIFMDDGMEALDETTAILIEQTMREEIQEERFGSLIVEDGKIALPQAHAIEVSLARELIRLSSAPCATPTNCSFHDKTLNEGQRMAVEGALHHTLCSITGGPGTGKTYTAGRLLRALASSYPSLRVALAAPTGRAVQTLEASIRSVLSGSPSAIIDAKTIHSLVSDTSALLPYHMVIVDECSMIDSQMMLRLAQRLHDGTRVVFLGDPGQLPPIEPGQPFFDLLTASEKLSQIGRFSLSECQRTSSTGLLELAHLVRQGDQERMKEKLFEPRNDVQFINCTTPDEWASAWTTIEEMSVQPWKNEMSVQEALGLQRTTVVLTPTRKGLLGSEKINHRAEGVHGKFCPVISLKNSYQLGIMNGDLGILERQSTMDYIHFHHCTVPAILCPKIERAFAITVHKSQGSEFDRVVIVLPPGTIVDRRLLYTAMTRAKQQVVIIGSQEDVLRALSRCQERVSTLSMRLQKEGSHA